MQNNFIIFSLNTTMYGIPALSVVEIIRDVEYSRFPGSPPHVLGLINLRGKLALAINLKKCLNLNSDFDFSSSICIFIEIHNHLIGLFVDKVNKKIDFGDQLLIKTLNNNSSSNNGLIKGVYKLNNDLVHEINVNNIL